ncbi:MAG: aldo/keto reductase [bacterium JZ-2024 1]
MSDLRRREFIRLAAGLAGGFAGFGLKAEPGNASYESLQGIAVPELPKVPLGKTGYRVTRVGMGGAIISHLPEAVGMRIVQDAYLAGINYFDTASQYGDGKSETMYGKALRSVRDRVVMATKTLRRRRDRAEKEIEESLARLQVDVLDILQIHAINTMDEWRVVASAQGALRAAEAFQKSRHVKHIGITGHRHPDILLTALKEYPFATVLLPISAADAGFRDFGEVVEYARSKGIGVIGMKVLAAGKLVGSLDVGDCIRYTLSRNVDTAIIGFSERAHVGIAAGVTKEFRMMSREERLALEKKAIGFANPATLWWKSG